MIVAFYPIAWTRLLRQHGVQIWQVESYSAKCDLYCYDIDEEGYGRYKQINKRLRITLFNKDVVEIRGW